MSILPSKFSFQLISKKKLETISKPNIISGVVDTAIEENITTDTNKRTFLKIAGVAGVSLIASQLFPKNAEALIMGGTPSSSVVGVKDANNIRIDPATEATIATLGSEATLATRASEATLSSIKTNSDKFQFDISGNLLTSTTGGASSVTLQDTTATVVNPATDDSAMLLRRLVRQVDSLAVVDSAQRQKVTIDSISGSLTLGTITTVGTVTTVTTVSTLTSATNLVALGGVDGRYLYIDTARNASSNGIRTNLIFS